MPWVWLAGAGMLAAALIAAIMLLNAGFAERQIAARLGLTTGLKLEAKGGARVSFAPLAAQLHDVVISSPDVGVVVTARRLSVPLGLGALLSRHADLGAATLEQPKFTFAIDAQGRANWALRGDTLNRALSAQAAEGEALRLTIQDGSVTYLDQTRGETFTAQALSGMATVSNQGGLELNGTASLASRFVKFNANIGSLARLGEDGSPANIALSAPSLLAGFSGRILARGTPQLAGTGRVQMDNLPDAVKWMALGFNVPAKAMSIDGSIDSVGATIRFPAATLVLDAMKVKGRAGLDFAPAKPVVTFEITNPSFTGGTGTAAFTLEANAGTAAVNVLQADLGRFGVEGSLAGQADIRADLKGQGADVNSILSSLSGTAALANGLGSVSSTGKFEKMQATFDVKAGIADTRDMTMRFNGNAFKGGGSVNIIGRKLDLTLSRPTPGAKAETLTIRGPLRALTESD
jgi:uncharacterized protein involved in outer membrane biogenesis